MATVKAVALGMALAIGAGFIAGGGVPAAAETAAAVQLTPEEVKEREMRKACKVSICDVFHNRKPGGDVACSVLKTWRKAQLEKMVARGKISWPWGKARCTADIKLPRAGMIKAMTLPAYELTLDKHVVNCELERAAGKEPYKVSFEFAPKVTFEKAKAVKAKLGWGRIVAPTLAKGALWSATAADNTFNVLQGTVIEDINDFVDKKCMEVKSEWQSR